MKLVNAEYCFEMDIVEEMVNILVIENRELFSKFIMEFLEQADGNKGEFVLSENGKELSLNKYVDIVIDVFSLDLNDKKYINKLHLKMGECAEDFWEEKELINTKIVNLLEKLSLKTLYQNIDYNLELEWNALFKLYAVRVLDEKGTLVEKLEEFLKLSALLCNFRVLVFVNLKTFLSEQELLNLYDIAKYLKLQLVLLEAKDDAKLSGESILVIDKDLCSILK